MIAALWGFLRGEVRVCVSGVSPERLLISLARRGVRVWKVRRLPSGALGLCLAPAGTEALYAEAARAGLSVERQEERGFPPLWRRLASRTGLVIGLPLALCALCAASQFLWDLRVLGVEEAERAEILAVLRREGVRIGTFLPGVDAEQVARTLVADLPELKWAAVNLHGSVARVEVRRKGAEKTPPAEAGDLIAERDGIVERIAVLAGTAAVSPGATVRAGDVLVWGYETAPDGSRRAVRAAADADARSWFSFTGIAERFPRVLCPTGREKKIYTLLFENFAQKLCAGSGILPPEYAKIEESSETSFSLRLLCVRGRAFEAIPTERGEREAEALLLAALRGRARRAGGEIRSEESELFCSGDCYTLRYSCETIGPIGVAGEEGKEWNRSSASIGWSS